MAERSRGPALAVTTRIGNKDIGPGTLYVSDDVITVAGANEGDRAIRVRLTSVDAIALHGTAVTITLHDGRTVTFDSDQGAHLRAELLSRCRTLPELTRALRALGSRRGMSARADAGEQQRFFAPLITARRQAAQAEGPADTIAAFDCLTLTRALDATLRRFANDRYAENGPERRAFEAALMDACEALRESIDALRSLSDEARGAVDDLGRWRAWSSQLRAIFEVADRAWLGVDAALGATPWQQ